MKEHERKFKLKSFPLFLKKEGPGLSIKQGYLFYNQNQYLRVRIIDDSNGTLCYKEHHLTCTRDEYEYMIPRDHALELYDKAFLTVEKERWTFRTAFLRYDIDLYTDGTCTLDVENLLGNDEQPKLTAFDVDKEISNEPEWTTYAIAMRLKNS
jgi:CYTH domain-containing protein